MADGSVAGGTTTRSTGRLAARDRRKLLRLALLILGPALVIVAAGYFYLTGGRYVATDNAYVRADIVQVSTDIAGMVRSVEVSDNQHVDQGQVLFRLDDAPFRYALDDAQAKLALARAGVEAMKTNWREKQQELKLAQINIDFAEREWKRRTELFGQHVVPQAQMDQAQQALDAARQQLITLQQQLATTVADLAGDAQIETDRHPRVLAAKAQLDQAQRNLDRTVVRAPFAGTVTNVPSLQPGMYLREAMAGMSLVASDHVWIEANPKETQLTWVQPGQKVTISVDTYPGETWEGSVGDLSPASSSQFAMLPAQNTSGNWVKVVQRIPLRILVAPDSTRPVLRAGMSAVVEIDTGHRRSWRSLLAGFGLG
ncbi:MAG TPA: HlyD family secretion protein [Aliidongia sp.]|nr:HlyD family secretion protein [Aliidongia sp.]